MIPSLEELLALRGAAQGLALGGGRLARASSLGAHASTHRGRGLEFQEVRPYVAGDDPRSIDWRVTARRGRVHTKLFREEREQPVWLLVDLQPGLFFGTRRQLKSALAVRAAALLAWTACLGGDRVGSVVCRGEGAVGISAARARQAGVLPLLENLLKLQPRAPAAPAPESLEQGLRALAALARPGSQVLVISDFATLEERTTSLWSALGAHSELQLFWITDVLEEQGLPPGRFRAGLPERLRILEGARLGERWRAAWREREHRLEALCRRTGAQRFRLDTREEVQTTLRPLLAGRRRAA